MKGSKIRPNCFHQKSTWQTRNQSTFLNLSSFCFSVSGCVCPSVSLAEEYSMTRFPSPRSFVQAEHLNTPLQAAELPLGSVFANPVIVPAPVCHHFDLGGRGRSHRQWPCPSQQPSWLRCVCQASRDYTSPCPAGFLAGLLKYSQICSFLGWQPCTVELCSLFCMFTLVLLKTLGQCCCLQWPFKIFIWYSLLILLSVTYKLGWSWFYIFFQINNLSALWVFPGSGCVYTHLSSVNIVSGGGLVAHHPLPHPSCMGRKPSLGAGREPEAHCNICLPWCLLCSH